MRHHVIAVVNAPRVGKRRKGPVRRFSALYLYPAALRDHSGLPDGAERISALSYFFIYVGQFEAAETALPNAGPDAILRIALNYAVGNSQCIAGLPVNSIGRALQRYVQMF